MKLKYVKEYLRYEIRYIILLLENLIYLENNYKCGLLSEEKYHKSQVNYQTHLVEHWVKLSSSNIIKCYVSKLAKYGYDCNDVKMDADEFLWEIIIPHLSSKQKKILKTKKKTTSKATRFTTPLQNTMNDEDMGKYINKSFKNWFFSKIKERRERCQKEISFDDKNMEEWLIDSEHNFTEDQDRKIDLDNKISTLLNNKEIVQLIKEGNTQKEIKGKLGITNINYHLRIIRKELM